jgi:hypothetical protein
LARRINNKGRLEMTMPRWGRYPMGTDFVSFERGPTGVTPEIVILKAQDGVGSRGVLYGKGTERTVVCIMHPRADMTRHYAIPYLVDGGYAFFAQESRWPGTDVATVHEMLVADVAAAMTYLRDRKFDNVILLGNSGAGSLYCLYQAQAETSRPNRLTDTAAGDPYDLNKFDLPPAQGVIFLGAHLGAGKILQSEIDPSVFDEKDPYSCDPDLDMYSSTNGFREPPQPSSYSQGFLDRYRAAQHARVARIDAIARGYIAEQRYFQQLAGEPPLDTLPVDTKRPLRQRAVHGRYLHVNRVEANPAAVDLSLNPSTRSYGSLMSTRPDISNYAEPATKILTPRAWLSSWSGLSSRASVLDNLPKVKVPTLVLNYTGDNAIHPHNSQAIYDQSPAKDKLKAEVEGDHFGLAPASMPKLNCRGAAATIMLDWLRSRFPA